MKVRSILVNEIAEILVSEFIGENIQIDGLIKLPNIPSVYSNFVSYCLSKEYFPELKSDKRIKALISTKEIYDNIEHKGDITYIMSNKPKEDFLKLHEYLANNTQFYNIYEFEKVIGSNFKQHPSAVIEDGVTIGDNVIVEANVVIYKGTKIGNDCIINANSVIGGTGFEVDYVDNKLRKITHVGGVTIEDNVEIGANTCIDKGLTDGDTIIGANTKIDNLVQIAHHCIIGKNVLICANAQLSGTVIVEDDCYIAPSVNIRNQVTIVKGTKIGMGAVVTKSIQKKGTYIGVPAKEMIKY